MIVDRRTGTEHIVHRITPGQNPDGLVLIAHFPYGDTETVFLTDADPVKAIAQRHAAAGARVAIYDGASGRLVAKVPRGGWG
jgi:hypothetical protein